MTESRPATLEPIFPFWVIWKWKWTVLAATVGVSAIGLVLGMSRQVKYEAIAVLAPEIRQVPGEAADVRLLETYMEVARQALLIHVEMLKTDAAMTAIAKASRAGDLEHVRARLRPQLAREPMTLRIAAWDEEPERAATLANAAAAQAIAHARTNDPRIDADKQNSLDKLRIAFDTRLAREAQALAQDSIRAELTDRQYRIMMLHGEIANLENRRRQGDSRAAEMLSVDKALSAARDELKVLQEEEALVNRTLERLQRETEHAAAAYETARAEYVQAALSLVSRMADLRLLHAADVPQQPMARHLNIIGAIGALCGLMTSAMAALYVEYMRVSNRRTSRGPAPARS